MSYYYERLQGWSEFVGLYRQWAYEAKPGARFVEVGIWRGRSTIAMAEFIRESGKQIEFIAIDHFQGSSEHQSELAETGDDLLEMFVDHAANAGVCDLIQLLIATSKEASESIKRDSCDLVYLDASHDHENVSADLNAWWPKVKPGGFLAGHDWGGNWPGVLSAVTEFSRLRDLPIEDIGSTWIIHKPCS